MKETIDSGDDGIDQAVIDATERVEIDRSALKAVELVDIDIENARDTWSINFKGQQLRVIADGEGIDAFGNHVVSIIPINPKFAALTYDPAFPRRITMAELKGKKPYSETNPKPGESRKEQKKSSIEDRFNALSGHDRTQLTSYAIFDKMLMKTPEDEMIIKNKTLNWERMSQDAKNMAEEYSHHINLGDKAQ